MLEAPEIQPDKLIACLQDAYLLSPTELTFLPLGADKNTAVYRVMSAEATAYFLKLRRGFDATCVLVPHLLYERGSAHVIPPLPTTDNRLWAELDDYAVILYPYVDGQDGYEVAITGSQWASFGAAVRDLHDMPLPPEIARRVPRETFSGCWRDRLRLHLAGLDLDHHDTTAVDMAAYLRGKRDEVLRLADRTEALAEALMAERPEFVLCHADLHAGNILISDERLFVVDWDTLLLAPRERDLMFPGGAQGFRGHSPVEEENLFYQGYGRTVVNQAALAHYRGERIIEDIVVECEQVFGRQAGEADRMQEFAYLRSNFSPDGTLAAFYRTESRQSHD